MNKLSYALWLAERGLRVFPLLVGGKHPAISAFQDRASADPETVTRMWTCPVTGTVQDYNIGVCTTGMVVADIDVKNGKAGLDTYRALGGHFDTFTVRTPSGGYHCYFEGPDSSLAVDLDGNPGLDIRSHHGYVVGPGSVVAQGEYGVVFDAPFAWVPAPIEARLKAPRERTPRTDGAELDAPTAVANAQVWLASADPAIEGLGGDSTTYAVACKLVRDFALSEETAFGLMSEHWNPRCMPPWAPDELWAKVENAGQYATGSLGSALPEATFGAVDIPEPPPVATGFQAPQGLDFGNAVLVSSLPPRPWLVPRLLMRRAVTLLAAAGAAGKTTFALTVAAHCAVGAAFGPYAAPAAPFKTVFYSAEEDRAELSRRLHALCAAYMLDFEAASRGLLLVGSDDVELSLAYMDGRVPTINVDQVQWLLDLVARPDVGMLVLDPFIETHMLDETDNAQMKFAMSVLRHLSREADIAVLLPHHASKGGNAAGRAGSADISRGASSIVNSARIALTLTGASDADCEKYGISEEDRRKFSRLDDAKVNLSAANSASVWFRSEGVRLYNGDEVGVLRVHDMEINERAMQVNVALVCIEAMGAEGSGRLSMASAVLALQQADPLYTKLSDKTIRARIERLLGKGVETANGIVQCVRQVDDNGRDAVFITLT